ncbi:MAG: hypothetical protein N4A71_00255 [Carboxylicivirga sp.]|nr:hypothetical protein [Carboxylicivirga sp.]
MDSTWLINNAERLWNDFDKRIESPEIDLIAISTIKDYSKIKRSVWSLQGSRWTDYYPFMSVNVIKGLDTLTISSFGQYPFMLPWNVSGKKIYNSAISILISRLLPDNQESNKSRLIGNGFNHYLIERIYDSYIEDNVEFAKAKNRYEKQFRYIEKDFEIKHAEMSYMASIEWGGWFGRPCLELLLIDSTISNQIQFSTIFSRHNIFHSPKSIIRNKEKLIGRLKDNPVYNYTLNCENCIGEIHWVQSKSLSGQAKRNFLRDVKENGLSKENFRGKFKNAVFFELTEHRDSKRSFSRWIFFKDGTIVLWELRGDYLMNQPDNITKHKGYICRVMTPKE